MSAEQRLWSLRSINGITFGCRQNDMLAQLGEPGLVKENFDGEVEFHFDTTIYRCFQFQFVECSFAASDQLVVDGAHILSAFSWLGQLPDVVDLARFRISLAKGVAYDFRNPDSGSITVFGPGHWDELVSLGQ